MAAIVSHITNAGKKAAAWIFVHAHKQLTCGVWQYEKESSMATLISGSGSSQAVMLRMCCGLLFVVLSVAAHKAQSAESSFAPDLDILTIQPTHSGADRLLSYRFNINIAFTRLTDTASAGPVSGNNAPRLHIIAEPKKEAAWSTDARWKTTPDSDRISLSPLLRFESKGERIEIKPRRHSVWVGWRKAFP